MNHNAFSVHLLIHRSVSHVIFCVWALTMDHNVLSIYLSIHLLVSQVIFERLGVDRGQQCLVGPPVGPPVGKSGHFQRLGLDPGPQRLVGPPVGKSGHFQRLGFDHGQNALSVHLLVHLLISQVIFSVCALTVIHSATSVRRTSGKSGHLQRLGVDPGLQRLVGPPSCR